jgi:hypothetical protein
VGGAADGRVVGKRGASPTSPNLSAPKGGEEQEGTSRQPHSAGWCYLFLTPVAGEQVGGGGGDAAPAVGGLDVAAMARLEGIVFGHGDRAHAVLLDEQCRHAMHLLKFVHRPKL